MLKQGFAFLYFFATLPAYAQTRGSNTKPLFFQAEKNKIQVLQQRFDYVLTEDNKLMVGDILIDFNQLTFQLHQSANKSYQAHFQWPADLFKSGELSIRNHSGKTIFRRTIPFNNQMLIPEQNTQKQAQLSQPDTSSNTTGLRNHVARLKIEDFPAELVHNMNYLPFIKLCILTEVDDTQIQLCSQEHFLDYQNKNDTPTIKVRESRNNNGIVEINRQVVSNQGMIYLNNRNEDIAFKAQAVSSAFLEVTTRMKDVDFKDVTQSNDGKTLTITASGSQPVDANQVRKISDSDWQIQIDSSRPSIYLKGDGDIPLRQEFLVQGPVPEEKHRAFLYPRSITSTYSANASLVGKVPEGMDVKILAGDLKSKVVKNKKNQFFWFLQDIPKGQQSRHYVSLITKENSFIAGYDIFRGEPFRASLSAQILTPSSSIQTNLEGQWWMEKLFNLNVPWAQFHWGLQVERLSQTSNTEDQTAIHFTNAEVLWRAVKGMNFRDETWGLSLPLQYIENTNLQTFTFGLGVFSHQRPQSFLTYVMDWSELKFQYFRGTSGKESTVSAAYRIKAHGYWSIAKSLYLKYGGEIYQYNLHPPKKTDDLQIGLDAGLSFTF